MTTPTVSIFDSTWTGIGAASGDDTRFPFLKVLRNPREIRNQVAALAKGRIKGNQESYYLIHHSDVIEIADKLDHLVPYPNVVIFSGASAGVHEGVVPRSRIERNIEDFLEYITSGDLTSARGVLLASEEVSQIDRIRVWLDRAQHDYVNLLAPLDLLALAFVGGELSEQAYVINRDKLLERLNQRTQEYLARGAENLRGMSRVFEEAIQVFRSSDPHRKYQPTALADGHTMHAQLNARVLHLDDELDRGWDLVMPLLFGSDYESFSDPAELTGRINELQDCAERFVVLLDLRLRNGEFAVAGATDGLEVLLAIRAKHRAIPVYVFTACDDYPSINATIEAGANGYIWKIARALEARPDRALIEEVRRQFSDARYDVFRSFLYQAFLILAEGLKSNKISPPFEDRYDRKWERRRKNLLFSLEQIVDCDFRRLTRDQGYADISLRNLIVALYRPFEREDPAGLEREDRKIRPHWKLSILKIYRNLSAHSGRETPVALDIRDAMIVALLMSDSATFDAVFPKEFCEHIRAAVSYLVIDRDANDVWHLWQQARRAIVPNHKFLLRKLQDEMPGSIQGHLGSYDRLLFHLLADRILRPKWADQASCRGFEESSCPPLELKRLNAVTTQAATPQVPPTQPLSIRPSASGRQHQKGMDHFFREVRGRKVIAFGQRYRDVVLDLSDPAQQDFFRWYYDKNVMPSRGGFTEGVLAFFDDHLGGLRRSGPIEPAFQMPSGPEILPALKVASESVPTDVRDPAASSEFASTQGETPQQTPARFGVSLYRVLDPKIKDPAATAKMQMRAAAGPDGQALHTNGAHIDWSHPVGHAERFSLGVTARERQFFGSDHRYVQLSPSVVIADKRYGSFLKSITAQSALARAAGHVPWLSKSQASADEFSGFGRLSEAVAKDDQRTFIARLGASLQGKGIAVVKGSPMVSDHAFADWKDSLARSGIVRVVGAEDADALIVIIPANSPPELLADVAANFSDESRPWKAVSPNAKYKDWNVLTGLATRFGRNTSPLFPTRMRDEGTFFVGLDLGHRSEGGSILAATLIDVGGQLVCWAESVNKLAHNRRHGERIDEATLKRTLEALLNHTLENLDSVPQRLVIHRDGRTLEPVERIVDWLDREFGIVRVDWLDVDKQRAPIFDLKTNDGIGHYVLYEDVSGRRELWLRTSAGTNGLLSRPLCIVPWVTDVDIESLALEVFDLANVAAQDYGRANRLPVTTYFADGFCTTGEKRVRFWGYEHLRVPIV